MSDFPRIIDDDKGTITAERRARVVRSWSYSDRKEQRKKMLMAREFAEGWYQAGKDYGAPEPDLATTRTN